jgi:hypothetical protein
MSTRSNSSAAQLLSCSAAQLPAPARAPEPGRPIIGSGSGSGSGSGPDSGTGDPAAFDEGEEEEEVAFLPLLLFVAKIAWLPTRLMPPLSPRRLVGSS